MALLITIADVLGAQELDQIRTMLAGMRFEDGRRTAGWSARLVKDNEQARAGASLSLLQERVSRAIRSHEVFELAVRPRTLTPLLFSRYGAGQHYGSHIDNPLMDGVRTDVSFTLFLADPETYAGGELVIETAGGEDDVKLPAGSMAVYPSTTLHRVAPVTQGERLVAVGWAQSYVRDAGRREILFDLENAKRRLFDAQGKTPEFDLVAKCAANLLRMWAE